jgi:hypothetical protein
MPNPVSPPPPPSPPQGSEQTSGQGQTPPAGSQGAYSDSIAIWQRFLSVGGHVASRDQAKQFMGAVMKAMTSYIQQCSDRMVQAIKKMKEDQEDLQ